MVHRMNPIRSHVQPDDGIIAQVQEPGKCGSWDSVEHTQGRRSGRGWELSKYSRWDHPKVCGKKWPNWCFQSNHSWAGLSLWAGLTLWTTGFAYLTNQLLLLPPVHSITQPPKRMIAHTLERKGFRWSTLCARQRDHLKTPNNTRSI